MDKKSPYYEKVAGYPSAIEVPAEDSGISAREASRQAQILLEEARKATKFANDAAIATTKAMESINNAKSDANEAVADANKAVKTANEAILKANSAADKVKTPYEIAIANGFVGSVEQWLESLNGDDGKSAYQIAVGNGFIGTEEQWLLSLKGDGIAMVRCDDTQTTKQILPNIFHVWGSVASLTITLAPEEPNTLNEYMFQFTSGETATALALLVTVILPDGFSIKPNTTYQISIVNNLLTYGGWDNE